MQNLDILGSEGFFLLCTLLRIMRQSINCSICFILAIIDLIVVTREFSNLVNLFGAQTLCVHEPMEVVVVGEYEDLVLAAFQIVSPGLKNLNNC